jgi:hypothetical protein
MINIKPGVQFTVLRSEMWGILSAVELMFKQYGSPCTITCGTDSHGPDDPHTHGFALDFRTHDVEPARVMNLKNEIMGLLGSRYFVLLENQGQDTEHIHIQIRKDLWPQLLTANGGA